MTTRTFLHGVPRPVSSRRAARRLALCLALGCALIGGCKARRPGRLEQAVVGTVKRNLTVGGRSDANPLPSSAAMIEKGRLAFGSYCAVCHGLDGQKTGVPFADAMSPPVPSLRAPDVQAYTDGQLKWIIENGLFPSGMPASRGLLTDEEMWRIVSYLRHLPAAGSLGEPPAYATGQAMPVAPR